MAKLDRENAFASILGSAKAGRGGGERQLSLGDIHLNPEQPRKYFGEEALEALTASIKAKGVLQPILVRERGDAYELVAGERRYRAAERAGLEIIPAIIRDLSDDESLEIALVENLQREDLNPVEETDATLNYLSHKLDIPVHEVLEAVRQSHYRALGRVDNNVVINPHVAAVEALFRAIGRSTASSFYSHRVPILKMPETLIGVVREGQLEYSKARALAGVKDEVLRSKLLERALTDGLSLKELKAEIVRQTTPEHPARQGRAETVDLAKLRRRLTPSRIDRLSPAKRRELDKLLTRVETMLEELT